MPALSLRALLARSIDYAGMFPPCSLSLAHSLENHAKYVRTPDSWMLASFVLPVAQFEAARENLSLFDPEHRLSISALGPKSERADAFLASLKPIAEALRYFSDDDVVSINQLEMSLPGDVDLASLASARTILGSFDLQPFWEAPADAAEGTIALLAEHNSSDGARPSGYKLRTGGVTAEAFPSAIQIAKALVAAAKHGVPIKFTAGLHHPVRQFREEVGTKMFGFLNVLGAALLASEHGWDEQQTAKMLEDENANSFSFDDNYFGWREWKIDNDQIIARRKLVTSFGSCSFDEPREDLRALNLL